MTFLRSISETVCPKGKLLFYGTFMVFFMISVLTFYNYERLYLIEEFIFKQVGGNDVIRMNKRDLNEPNMTKKIFSEPIWTPLVFNDTSGRDPDPEIARRRDFIKNMMKHAWKNYEKYAWGENELKPISLKAYSSEIFGSNENSKLGKSNSIIT